MLQPNAFAHAQPGALFFDLGHHAHPLCHPTAGLGSGVTQPPCRLQGGWDDFKCRWGDDFKCRSSVGVESVGTNQFADDQQSAHAGQRELASTAAA